MTAHLRRLVSAFLAVVAGLTTAVTIQATPAHAAVTVVGISGWGRFQNLNASTKYLSIAAAQDANGAHATIYQTSGTNDQLWQILYLSNNNVTFRNALSWRVLGIDGSSTANLAHAMLWSSNGNLDQQWRYGRQSTDSLGRIWRELVNANSDRCLGVEAGSAANNAHVVQFSCTASTDQRWHFTGTP